jgi:hypothetical protein
MALGLAMLAFAGSSTATPIDWRKVPYLDWKLGQLFVATDGSWSNAKVINTGLLKAPAGYAYIWSPTCTESAQFVSFSKTILTPGAPTRGTADFTYGPGRDRPFLGGTLLVNGVEIGRIGKSAGTVFSSAISGPLPASALKAFRYGSNTLTIRVQRAALQKGQSCYDAKVPRYVSVTGSISLKFGADLVAVPSNEAATRVIHNVGPGSKATISGAARFKNKGPSSALGGRIQITFSGDAGVQALLFQNLSTVRAPFAGCTWHSLEAGSGSADAQCSYEELRPGQQSQVTLVAGYLVGSSFPANAVRRLTLAWLITSDTAEESPGAGDETSKVVFVLCGSAATDPACA